MVDDIHWLVSAFCLIAGDFVTLFVIVNVCLYRSVIDVYQNTLFKATAIFKAFYDLDIMDEEVILECVLALHNKYLPVPRKHKQFLSPSIKNLSNC